MVYKYFSNGYLLYIIIWFYYTYMLFQSYKLYNNLHINNYYICYIKKWIADKIIPISPIIYDIITAFLLAFPSNISKRLTSFSLTNFSFSEISSDNFIQVFCNSLIYSSFSKLESINCLIWFSNSSPLAIWRAISSS